MIFIGILLSMATIAFLCWLLFTLAIFALPLFAGITAGTWAYGTGGGWPGAILVGFAAAALTFGLGRFLVATVRPIWTRLLIAAVFVMPAVAAGFHATHGIVKYTTPSQTWQMVFSILGAGVVGIVAFVRNTGRKAFHPSDGQTSLPDTTLSARRTRRRMT